MLYVTTRGDRDAYTAGRTMRDDRGPDGGFYLPLRGPSFSPKEIASLKEMSFGGCVAEVLNRLFSTKLTGWDVDFAAGRNVARIADLGQRVFVGEVWHNPEWDFTFFEKNLAKLLPEHNENGPSNWVRIAVRSAVLFGLYGELLRLGITESVDLALLSGDFYEPVSAVYAKQWGLPIEGIVCCCNENNGPWELVYHGQFKTDSMSMQTSLPEADVAMPYNLERLIYACGGESEVTRFLEARYLGKNYYPSELCLESLQKTIQVSVVSSGRISETISGVYGTSGYLLSPITSLNYSGLLDYKAKKGSTRHALILSDSHPGKRMDAVAGALRITTDMAKKIFTD